MERKLFSLLEPLGVVREKELPEFIEFIESLDGLVKGNLIASKDDPKKVLRYLKNII